MRRFYLFGFLCLMAFDTAAQTCFKLTGMNAAPLEFNLAWVGRVLTTPWAYGSLVGYLGSFATWMTLLRHVPIGPAYAASHLELVSVTILSACFFHEPLTVLKVIGGLLILLGVLCLAKGESIQAAARDAHIQAMQSANQA